MAATEDNQPRDSDTRQAAETWSTRRWRVVVGVTGLAAVLGAGAYVLTDRLTENRTTVTTGQPRPLGAAPAVTPPTHVPEPSATVSAGQSRSPSATPSPSPISSKVLAEIMAARRKMAEDGVKVKRPLSPQSTATADEIQATTEGSLQKGGIIRVVTARGDLTGQRELAWVAGGVTRYRGVPCSQTIRVSPDTPPARKANLLICWRTSAVKSVVSIVVDPKGHPSRAKAVAALEGTWRKMG